MKEVGKDEIKKDDSKKSKGIHTKYKTGKYDKMFFGEYKIQGFKTPGEVNLVWVFQVPFEPSNQLVIHKVCVHAENVMIILLDLIKSSYTYQGS